MLVYLDESGDTGFRFPGSSRFFVVTLLVVDDQLPIHNSVIALRESLGFGDRNEFKFMKASTDVRWAFLGMMKPHEFSVRVLVLDKHLCADPRQMKAESLYGELVRMVLDNDDGAIQDAVLILDESFQGKRNQRQFGSYLRKQLNSGAGQRRIREIKYHRSSSDLLIQATDMISGAIYAKYNRGNSEYYDYLRPKIAAVWERTPRQW